LPRHMCYFFLPTPPILPFLAVALLLLSGSFRLPVVLCLVVTAPKKDSSRPAKQTYYSPCSNEQCTRVQHNDFDSSVKARHNMTSWCLLFVCYKRLHAGEQQHPCTLTTLAECKQAMQLSLLECTCGANDSLIGYSTFGSKEMERVTHNVSKLYIRTDLGRICPWCHAPS